MKLAKINKDIIIQYTCNDCGGLISEAEYGEEMCQYCKEPINKDSKFYCIGEGKHIHKRCKKDFKESSK